MKKWGQKGVRSGMKSVPVFDYRLAHRTNQLQSLPAGKIKAFAVGFKLAMRTSSFEKFPD